MTPFTLPNLDFGVVFHTRQSNSRELTIAPLITALTKAQMKDQDERERSWKRMRRAVARRSSTKLAQRIGGFGSR